MSASQPLRYNGNRGRRTFLGNGFVTDNRNVGISLDTLCLDHLESKLARVRSLFPSIEMAVHSTGARRPWSSRPGRARSKASRPGLVGPFGPFDPFEGSGPCVI